MREYMREFVRQREGGRESERECERECERDKILLNQNKFSYNENTLIKLICSKN